MMVNLDKGECICIIVFCLYFKFIVDCLMDKRWEEGGKTFCVCIYGYW